MGKRVFEIAKDLRVDHRELLKKCDELGIEVRNYMSELARDDVGRLRQAFSGAASGPVEVQSAPGVVRRRRAGTGRAATREASAAAGSPSPAAEPAATPAKITRRAPATPEKKIEPRAVEKKQVVVRKVVRKAPAEVAEAAAPAPAPAAEAPAPPPAEPAEAAPKQAEPEAPEAKTAEDGTPVGATRSIERTKTIEKKKPAPEPEAQAAPEPEQAAAEPTAEQVDAEPAQAADADADADAGEGEGEEPNKPSRRTQQVAKGVTRRSGGGKKDTERTSKVRKPETRTPGSAKVLGTIPLEQLRARTARPAQRSGRPPRRRGPGGPTGPTGRPPASRGGPRGAPNFGPPMPPPPGAAGDRDRGRRRGPGGPPGARSSRPSRSRNTSRRRRVFSREDLYKGGGRVNRGRKRKMSSRKGAKTQLTTPAAHKRVVRIDDTISVGELGKALGVKVNELISKLMGMGVMATVNQQVDVDTAALLATEYDYEVKNVAFQEDEVLSGPVDDEAIEVDPDAESRAPVVTIMGHVDHGKTTLLDNIRKANVAEGEAGGITQHIGAYRVSVGDKAVVFLDTPGHAAFTAMRARGASATDIVVLVVAADDGPMPQTVESINHAKAAGVPIIVAINKMDKPGVDPERIKQELTQFDLVPEEWGGDTMFVPVSALKGTGIDDLLEALVLQAEVLELKANPKKPAYGTVIEAKVQKGRGNVCTVLVQEGTLKKGVYIVSGEHYGRLRAMIDDRGKRIKSAGPSTPVEVLGLGGLPPAGEAFQVADNEREAKKVVGTRTDKSRAEDAKARQAQKVADLMAELEGKAERETQNIILKTDVAGSLEAIRGSLEQLATEEVEVKLVHSAVGNISESDVTLATATESIIVGFNVKPDSNAKRAADQADVQILNFSVIYDVLDTVKEMLSGLLSPETVEETLGHAEVRAVFQVQRIGAVAGCHVQDGKVVRGAMARVMRDGEQIAEGKVTTLKRFKDDVREVTHGYECGLSVDGYKDVQEGDLVEVYSLKEVRRQID